MQYPQDALWILLGFYSISQDNSQRTLPLSNLTHLNFTLDSARWWCVVRNLMIQLPTNRQVGEPFRGSNLITKKQTHLRLWREVAVILQMLGTKVLAAGSPLCQDYQHFYRN
jgi:hypothetical protein